MSGDPYNGWEGFCHPDAPAGGGGPGFFGSAHPAGMDLDQPSGPPHPDSPAAHTSLAAAAAGVQGAAKPPAFLETFKSGINDFPAEELNEALFTLFGELSSQLHDQLSQEARTKEIRAFESHGLSGAKFDAVSYRIDGNGGPTKVSEIEQKNIPSSEGGAFKRVVRQWVEGRPAVTCEALLDIDQNIVSIIKGNPEACRADISGISKAP